VELAVSHEDTTVDALEHGAWSLERGQRETNEANPTDIDLSLTHASRLRRLVIHLALTVDSMDFDEVAQDWNSPDP
jgi:hypothetical protein